MQRADVSGVTANAGKAVAGLGILDGPVLVFGGPYSNLEATEAMLAVAAARGIPPERIVCTGDVVAYCADPEATVRAVREAGVHVVMGNCEESLARSAPDCGCGFAVGSACQGLSEQWYAYAKGQLSAGARRWMAGLPRQLRFAFAGRRFAVVHGSASSINRFIFASTPAAEKAAEIAKAGVDAIIGGHSGLPFSQLVHGRLWHNAGAVGLNPIRGSPVPRPRPQVAARSNSV